MLLIIDNIFRSYDDLQVKKYKKEKEIRLKFEKLLRNMKKKCRDRASFCKQFKSSINGKKPLLDCVKIKHLSKRHCPLTCGFCTLENANQDD